MRWSITRVIDSKRGPKTSAHSRQGHSRELLQSPGLSHCWLPNPASRGGSTGGLVYEFCETEVSQLLHVALSQDILRFEVTMKDFRVQDFEPIKDLVKIIKNPVKRRARSSIFIDDTSVVAVWAILRDGNPLRRSSFRQ